MFEANFKDCNVPWIQLNKNKPIEDSVAVVDDLSKKIPKCRQNATIVISRMTTVTIIATEGSLHTREHQKPEIRSKFIGLHCKDSIKCSLRF
jgi:hypothetical protein